jgi:hypothetical protein
MGYIRGGNWAICDVCGFKYRAFDLRRRWDGALCCSADWELRNPQDYLRGVPDNPTAPVTNPEQPDKFQLQTIQDATGIPIVDAVTGLPVQIQIPQSSKDIGIIQYED